jgi:hypothetical protein
MKVCCGIITTYNLKLQFTTSSDSSNESLKAKKTYGGERKKVKRLPWKMKEEDGQ